MRIIDAHAHLFDQPGYLDNLLKTMRNCGIEKCCISGLGKLFRCVDNEGVKSAFKRHPDQIIGVAFIRPGVDDSSIIHEAHAKEFRMLKVTIPTKPYDDPSFFPLWETAQELKMPILFHTGIITLLRKAPKAGVSSWNMHPMRLEPISNAFPKLKIIIAHLGVHWNDDAAELIRMRPNVYADLTGDPNGWRQRADETGMIKWLWWPGAFKKIIFGTDVIHNKIPTILAQDKARLEKYNIDQETQKMIFSENILKLMGMR